MNMLFPIVLIVLESALVFAFTTNILSALIFPVLLPLLFLNKTENKALKAFLLLVCLVCSAFFAVLTASLITSTVLFMLACQCTQIISINLAAKHRTGSVGLLFTLAGVVFAYIAYSPFFFVLDIWLSNILGTLILVFAVLSSGTPTSQKNKADLHVRRQGSMFRYVILSVLVCISIAVASWLSPSVEYASEELEYWISGLSFGKKTQTATKGKGKIKNVPGPLVPSDYLSGGTIELKKKYDIKLPHRPEIHLLMHENTARRMQRNDVLYIKCLSFDHFDAKRWSSSLPGRKLIKDEDDGKTDGTIVLNSELRNPVTYSVMFQSYSSRVLPCISEVSALEFRAVEMTQNDIFYSAVSLDHLPLLSYTVTSSDVRWHDIVRNRRNIGDPGEEYLQMPMHPLSGRIKRLSQEIVGDENDPVISVEKLLRHIHRRCSYSLKTENKSDMHPIDNFLFEEKKGHCELFASSFTLMLRSIGVPARMTCGYGGGEYDSARDLYTFFQDNAHAWVEIYLEEYGWVLIDPTPPGQTPAARPPRLASFNGSFSPESYVHLGALVNIGYPVEDDDIIHKKNPLYEKIMRFLSSPVSISLFAVIAGLSAAFFIRKPQKDFSTALKSRSRRKLKDMPDYFRLFCRYFSKMGYPLRRGQTPREYLLYLKTQLHLDDEYDRMIEYFEQVCYGQRARSKAIEKEFSTIIRNRKVQGPENSDNKGPFHR